MLSEWDWAWTCNVGVLIVKTARSWRTLENLASKVCFGGWGTLEKKIESRLGFASPTFKFFPNHPTLRSIIWEPNFPRHVSCETTFQLIPRHCMFMPNLIHILGREREEEGSGIFWTKSEDLVQLPTALLQIETEGEQAAVFFEPSNFKLIWKYLKVIWNLESNFSWK